MTHQMTDKPTVDESPDSTSTVRLPNGTTLAVGGGLASLIIAGISLFGSFSSDISRIDAVQQTQREAITAINTRLDRQDAALNELQRNMSKALTLLEGMDARQRRDIADK
jgi:hypothetical protein